MTYATVVGILVAGAAWLAERGLLAAGRPARWVWAVAMTGAVSIPFLFGAGTPHPDLPPDLAAPPLPVASSASGTADPLSPRWGLPALGWATRPLRTVSTELTRGPDQVSRWLSHLLPAAPSDRTLGAVWGGGTALLLLAWLAGALRLRARLLRWPAARIQGVPVRIAPDLGPAVAGAIRPAIVLPRWSLGLPRGQMRTVLLHEGEHLRARDTALLGASGILAMACFWNPAVWWILGRLRNAVEVDCDRRVLQRGVAAPRYGALLLEVAARGGRPLLTMATLSESSTPLERRLKQMRTSPVRHPILAVGASLLAAALLLVVACETEPATPTAIHAPESEAMNPAPEAMPSGEAETGWSIHPEASPGNPLVATGVRIHGLSGDRPFTRTDGPSPKIFVDGVVVRDHGPLSDLRPDHIQRIEIVKGEAAEARFGAEGRNGVILITTESASGGEEGRPLPFLRDDLDGGL
jgi:bla regulator protein blaR1